MKTLITTIIDLVSAGEFYGISETIDIAKGKYQLPSNGKEIIKSIKRNKKY